MRCNQCESVSINGIPCHEAGCPNSHIDLSTGGIKERMCPWCGTIFEPEDSKQRFCDFSCAEFYLT